MRLLITKSALGSVLVLSIILLGKFVAEAGVDIKVYQKIIYTSPVEWGAYYLGNFVSWLIVYWSFAVTEGNPVGVSLAVLDLTLWGMFFLFSKRDEIFNVYLAPMALFSAVGILLSHNVLRQYIATVFILIACVRFFQNRGARTWPFLILAVFSHFVAVVFIVALLLSRFNAKRMIIRMMLFPVVYALGTALFFRFRPQALVNAGILGDSSSEMYAFLLLALATFALFHLKKYLCFTPNQETDSLQETSRFLFYSFVIILAVIFSSPPIWLINRFLISFIFLTAIFGFIIMPNKRSQRRHFYGVVTNLVLACVLLASVFLHTGAQKMIGLG